MKKFTMLVAMLCTLLMAAVCFAAKPETKAEEMVPLPVFDCNAADFVKGFNAIAGQNAPVLSAPEVSTEMSTPEFPVSVANLQGTGCVFLLTSDAKNKSLMNVAIMATMSDVQSGPAIMGFALQNVCDMLKLTDDETTVLLGDDQVQAYKAVYSTVQKKTIVVTADIQDAENKENSVLTMSFMAIK